MKDTEALSIFGYSEFRDGQKEIVDEIISPNKRGVLVVCPTGWGKSAVYQIPALMMDGMAIVISPLIALMKDQVDKLQELGIKAVSINSNMTIKEGREVMSKIANKEVKILYISPERFDNENFKNAIANTDIGLIAIDEAHCVSRWGHDFRKAYARLGSHIHKLNPRKIIALTATATKTVQDDIVKVLKMDNAKKVIRGLYRENLKVSTMGSFAPSQRTSAVSALIEQFGDNVTGIIYVATRKECENLKSQIASRGYKVSSYHGGMVGSERTIIQNDWMENGGVIIATSAFGMGIDRADVRFVLFLGIAQSIEDWYQAVGRAGRDGKESICLTLWNGSDYHIQTFLINCTAPPPAEVKVFQRWLMTFAKEKALPEEKEVLIDMTQKEMSKRSKCKSAGACVSFLRSHNLIKTIGRGKYSVALTQPELDYDALKLRREDKFNKLEEVLSFYKSRKCRSEYVCKYFGDESFSTENCKCDNCNKGR